MQALLAARLDALEPFERRLVQQAAVVGARSGRARWPTLAEAGGPRPRAARSARCRRRTSSPPSAESRLAGEREFAFKHVLIRDVAYGMLPKAVRWRKHFEVGRFIEERAGDRTDEVVALLAEHYGRAAALGEEAGADPGELRRSVERAVHFLEEAGRRRGRAVLQPRGARATTPRARPAARTPTSAAAARIGEKQGDVALRHGPRRRRRSRSGRPASSYHRGRRTSSGWPTCTARSARALAVKGERKAAIEHYQKGINLLKDGPPRLELVHLYEEAAWLYMHTGDNMLAIYASEKALRLAERLGETRAASRAHGIFGRVFGRIGDTEKARENLERSVELARGSDPGETIVALLTLGHHLELSEADYARRRRGATARRWSCAEQVGDLPAQVELHAALAQLAAYRADWDAGAASTDASAELAEREGLVSASCACPTRCAALLRWREGELDGAEQRFRAPTGWPSRSAGRRSRSRRSTGWR